MKILAEVVGTSLNRYGLALEYPDFRTMWLANMSAHAAAWALIVARGWLVFDLTQSSFMVGMVTFAATAPLLIMPAIAGVLADRMDRRNLLAITYAVNLVHNVLLAGLGFAGVIHEWHLLSLSVVNGLARATQISTSQALAASLVPPEHLLNALSLNNATQHASRLVGPGLASPLLGFLGAPPAFLLCTALYGIALVLILRVRAHATGGVRRGESFVSSFKGGIRYAWGQPLIRMVLVLVFFHCGLTMAFEALLPAYAAQQMGRGTEAVVVPGHEHQGGGIGDLTFNAQATGFATLMMGVGAGAFVGSLMIGGVRSAEVRGQLYLWMGLLSGLGQVLLAIAPSHAVAIVAAAIMGGSQAAFMTMGQALMQSLAADEFRGRVASLNTLSFGGIMSVMNLVNGTLGTQFSAAAILLFNGVLFALIMGLSFAFATPRRVYLEGMPARAVPA
jgi:MFS family permease